MTCSAISASRYPARFLYLVLANKGFFLHCGIIHHLKPHLSLSLSHTHTHTHTHTQSETLLVASTVACNKYKSLEKNL
jgi:hypothetical protein